MKLNDIACPECGSKGYLIEDHSLDFPENEINLLAICYDCDTKFVIIAKDFVVLKNDWG